MMVNTVLSGARTTPLALSTSDRLYIAPSGSITLATGTAPAIATATTAESSIDIGIDGRIVTLEAMAIELARDDPASNGIYAVNIGATGSIYAGCAFDDAAIRLVGGSSGVTNFGAITSAGTGVRVEGSNGSVRNFGTINAEATAVSLVGNLSRVVNGGTVIGVNGVSVTGNMTQVENHGTIEAMPVVNSFGFGAVNIMEFGTARFVNTGLVNGFEVTGLRLVSGVAGAVMNVENSGTIASSALAVGSGLGTGSVLSLVNSGTISGGSRAISLGASEGQILNAAGGLIQASGGAAISANEGLSLTNFGEVLGAGEATLAIRLDAGAGFTSITNHGTIASTFASAIDASAVLTGGSVFVTNFGTVSGGYTGAGASDFLKNFGGMDAVSTGNGNDTVRNAGLIDAFVLLGSGDDTYRGAGGRVEGQVDGGVGADTLLGGDLEDDLRGGVDDDRLSGRGGDDTLTGSTGADSLDGGAGNDSLQGGTDQDVLTGGGGDDRFVFASALEISSGSVRDSITDFGGKDRIDLSAFMSGASFIGGDAFSGTGPEVRYSAASGRLIGDVDGDGSADWLLDLAGDPAIKATHLIL
jgi:Ca2+-binding RTX toxin-like protein